MAIREYLGSVDRNLQRLDPLNDPRYHRFATLLIGSILLVPFNGLHRYLPAIFTQAGLEIAEIDVNHHERKAGESKYTNFDRALRGIYDIIGVCWLPNRKVVLPSLSSCGKEKKS